MELDDLKNIAPNLSKIKKEENFSVPDGYFENFRQRLDEKIHTEEKISLFDQVIQFIRPQLALASLMVSILVIGFFGVKFLIPQQQGNAPGTIDQNTLALVLEDELYYMDESFIIETLVGEQEAEPKEKEEVSQELVNEIINYLSEDDMSLDLILEDL